MLAIKPAKFMLILIRINHIRISLQISSIVLPGNITSNLTSRKKMKKLSLIILLLILTSCGSTSQMRNAQKMDAPRPDLSSYHTIIINDFSDGVSKDQKDAKIIEGGKRFADMIATEIKSKNAFNKVERNIESTDDALLIDGKITQYEEGNPAMRAMIGLGAGSSHFDAEVFFKDNKTKKILSDIKVDQMSWALGGIMAATQDVKSHMMAASTKIASELVAAKGNSNIAKQ
jgi:hypothetical protein